MAKRRFIVPSLDDTIEDDSGTITSHFKPGQIKVVTSSTKEQEKYQNKADPSQTSTLLTSSEAKSGHGDAKEAQATINSSEIKSRAPGDVTDNPDDPTMVSETEPPKLTTEQILATKNCVMVNSRQKGNPLLKNIRNVPWEFCEIEPDYIMSPSTCTLFLSLRYHNLYPQYIHERLKSLGKSFQLRILLIQIDVSDPFPPLKDLAKIAILTDCTLLLAWSSEEAGKIIETYKVFENKSPDLIMERLETDVYTKAIDALSSVKSVNRTDATTLLSTFATLEKLGQALPEELALCPGMGPLKAKRLYELFRKPFIETRK